MSKIPSLLQIMLYYVNCVYLGHSLEHTNNAKFLLYFSNKWEQKTLFPKYSISD